MHVTDCACGRSRRQDAQPVVEDGALERAHAARPFQERPFELESSSCARRVGAHVSVDALVRRVGVRHVSPSRASGSRSRCARGSRRSAASPRRRRTTRAAPARGTSSRRRCSRDPCRRGRGSARSRGARTGSPPRDRWYRRTVAGEQTKAAMAAQPEWLAQVPTDAALPRRRAAPLHRLRHLVPRGVDRRGGGSGARARARARARRRPARPRLARRGDADSRSRPRARGAGRSGSSPARPTARSPSSATRCRVHAGDRGELVPHRELHVRGRDARGASRRRRLVAAGRRCRGARSPGPIVRAGAVAHRRCGPRLADGARSGLEVARGRVGRRGGIRDRAAPPRRTSPPWTSASVRSSSKARDARRSVRADAVAALRVLGCDVDARSPTVHPVVDDRHPFQPCCTRRARGARAAASPDPDPPRRRPPRAAAVHAGSGLAAAQESRA